MDRRQLKTRKAIFDAFAVLLGKKPYAEITVQEIIDGANIGRSTFYDHFDTKDALLKILCSELFDHMIRTALDSVHTQGLYSNEKAPDSICLHMLQHLQDNSQIIMALLCGENNELFMRYFRDGMQDVAARTILCRYPKQSIPEELLARHIADSYITLLTWWAKHGMQESPQQLDAWFRAMLEPVLVAGEK
jgi:AcrR family transcriptional regulator